MSIRLEQIDRAIALLSKARDELKQARCPNATNYVRRAMKSAYGARRNAQRFKTDDFIELVREAFPRRRRKK
jgi:hypothetical protein